MTVSERQAQAKATAEHLAAVYEINRAINSSLELDEVMEAVMDTFIEVIRAQRGFLMLRDDDGKLRVKVARGLNKEDLDTPDFQYSTTIVNKVAESGEPLLTNNADHDPRFVAGQSIIALGLRSVMAAPIYFKERMSGLVYVDNSLRAGIFNEDDLALLTSFAATAGIALENARLHQVELKNARREKELSMAHDIQRSLLPSRLPTLPGYEIAAYWRSAREVAGDFYDVFKLSDQGLGVVIADVSDKGVPAALFMAVARSLIRGSAMSAHSPVETLQQANRLILEDSGSGMFVTAYYTVFEVGGQATGISAGHNRPVLYRRREHRTELLPRGGWALGWFENIPLSPWPIQLEQGDVLAFYTDGLTEAENSQGEFFGEDRLLDLLRNHAGAGLSAQAIMAHISEAVDDFVGDAPPSDDMTMVIVRYVGAE